MLDAHWMGQILPAHSDTGDYALLVAVVPQYLSSLAAYLSSLLGSGFFPQCADAASSALTNAEVFYFT